jgi:predicted Zn-dependent protease
MLTRFFKLLIALAVLAALLYVVSSNRDPVTLNIYGDWALKDYSLGVMSIVLFSAGILAASLGGLVLATPGYFKQRSLMAKLKNAEAFHARVAEARAASAARQWARARSLWEQLLKKDPTDAIAAIELSKVLEQLGEHRHALKELTLAKAKSPKNIEVLVRCAEVNLSLENKTAALDNLSQVLALETNRFAAEWAMQLCEETENFEDALEYLEILESLGSVPVEISQRVRLAHLLDNSKSQTVEEKRATLKKFVRKFPKSTGAIRELAKLETEEGNFNESCKLLLQSFKLTPSVDTLDVLVQTCQHFGKLEEAAQYLAQAEQSTELSAPSHLVLAKHFLNLKKPERANASLAKAREKLGSENETWSKQLTILESLSALSAGNTDSAKTALSSAV